MLEFIILGFLKEHSMNGYQLKQRMSVGTSNFMDASYGSLYPALKRLAKKEFISSSESIENGKYTKIYCVTKKGEEAFIEWLKIPAEISGKPHDHITKLYFYSYIDEKTRIQHYKYYIKSAEYEKQKLVEIMPLAVKTAAHERLQTMEYGVRYYDNLIAFYTNLLNGGSDILRYIK